MKVEFKMKVNRPLRLVTVTWRPTDSVQVVHTGMQYTYGSANYRNREVFLAGKPAGYITGGDARFLWEPGPEDEAAWPMKGLIESSMEDLACLLSRIEVTNAAAVERQRRIAALPEQAESDVMTASPSSDYW